MAIQVTLSSGVPLKIKLTNPTELLVPAPPYTFANVLTLLVGNTLTVGNTSTNTQINSTSITVTSINANGSLGVPGNFLTSNGTGIYWSQGEFLTANDTTYLNGQPASFYTNATNITTGTLPVAQLPSNIVFWSNTNTFTAVQTFNQNVVVNEVTFSVGNTTSNITANTTELRIGNSTVNVSINSTAFSGTANNANNFDGLSLATLQGQITGNAATAYSNAVANAAALYQTMAGLSANVATLTSNNSTNLNGQPASFYTNATNITTGTLAFARLPANVVFWSNTNSFSAVQTFNQNLIVNAATLSVGNTTSNITANTTVLKVGNSTVNVSINSTTFSGTANNSNNLGGSSLATIQGQITGNASTAYANAVANAAALYQTTAGLAANVATLTANNSNNLGGQNSSFYTNATNITTGTLPVAQLPANIVFWSNTNTFTAIQTTNANLIVNAATLSVGNTTSNITANTTVLSVGNSTVNVSINSTAFSGTSNNSNNLGGSSLATIQGQITGNASTAYANAVANAAALYQTTAGLAANVATLTSNNSTNLGGQNSSFYTNATNITTGTLPVAQLPANLVFWSNTNTFTAVQTTNANLIVNAATLAVGNTTANITANTTVLAIGNSTVNVSINSTAFSGTANNSTNLGGQPASFYTNATNITTGTLAFARLPANAVFWSNTNTFTAVQTFNQNVVVNSSTLSVGNTTSNITANTTVLKVGNTTVNVTINSTAFSGIANNSNNLNGQPASFYTNATNLTTGTLPFARLPANAVFWSNTNTFTAVQTFNQNLIVNSATLSVGNTTSNITANTTVLKVGNSTVNVSINSTSFTGTANNSTNLGGSSLATIQSEITGNAATAYSNAVANAAALYQTTAGLAANVATLTANNSNNLGGIPSANYALLSATTSVFTGNIVANNANTTNNLNVGGDLTVQGNVFVTGGVVSLLGNTITFVDNMIFLNQGIFANITNISGNGTVVTFTANNNYQVGWDVFVANVTPSSYNGNYLNIIAANATHFQVSNTNTDAYVSGGTARGKTDLNPDLGLSAGYNDGTYQHTGIFRDASDGFWKVFDGYLPEPDASVFIDTSNASFNIANFHAGTIRLGNTTVYGTVNTTIYSGTANNSNNLNGQPASFYTNATNLTTGTLPVAQLPANLVFWSNTNTFTAVQTFNQNLIVNAATVSVGNTTANITANTTVLKVGNTTVNVTINSTAFSGIANNANNLGGQLPAFYTNATNITTGTLAFARLPANAVFWSNTNSFSAVQTFNQNLIVNSAILSVGNSTVNVSINSTAFTGTANNSTNLGGSSLATIQGQITGNAATAYTNAVADAASNAAGIYQTTAGLSANVATLTSNNSTNLNGQPASFYTNATNITTGTLPVAQLPANLVFWSNTNIFTAVQTFNQNVVVNAVTFSVGNTTANATVNTTHIVVGNSTVNVSINSTAFSGTSNNSNNLGGSSLATIQGQITGNASTAYANAVANAAALYQTTAGLAANVATLTANNANNLNGQNAAFYTNATNITTGTLAFARLPANLVFWSNTNIFTAVQTFNQNVVVNAATLSVGNTTANITANTTELRVGNSTVNVSINSTAFSGTANNASNLGGSSLATIQGQITGNAATAYSNAVANAAALYQTTAGLAANVATLTANNSTNLNGQPASFYTNATNITTGTLAFARLPANAVFWSNTNTFTAVQTFNQNVVVNSAILSVGNTTVNVSINSTAFSGTSNNATNLGGSSLATIQGQITGNAATAYSNAVANAAALYQTMAGLSANVATLTSNNSTNLNGQPASFYTNATNITTGTLPVAQLPANVVFWSNTNSFSAVQTINANLIVNSAILSVGNSTVNVSINSTAFSGTANNASNLGGSSLATIQGQITGNAATAYSNAVANAAALYQTTAGLAANVATLTSNNSTNLNGQPASFYTNATNITTGTLPVAQLPANLVFWSNTNSFSAVQTFNQNVVVNAVTFSVGNTVANITANTTVLTIGNSTVNVSINSTAFSGTSNNATNLGGSSLATIQGQITGNASTAYANAVANAAALYQTTAGLSANVLTLTANDSTNLGGQPASFYTNATNITTGTLPVAQLPANVVFWSNTNIFTAVQTTNANLIVNSATLSVGNTVANITANTTELRVGNSTVNVSINSTAFSGTSANATNLDGQPGSYYTNADNIATGTVPTARLASGTANSTTFLRGDSTWAVTGTLSDSYESVNKNLKAYDATLAYHGNGFLNTITYSIPPSSSIVKTFGYTGSALTSIVLSGSTPGGIDLTKTFGYTGNNLTSVAYS